VPVTACRRALDGSEDALAGVEPPRAEGTLVETCAPRIARSLSA
jgi:hypothetical protein